MNAFESLIQTMSADEKAKLMAALSGSTQATKPSTEPLPMEQRLAAAEHKIRTSGQSHAKVDLIKQLRAEMEIKLKRGY